MTKRPDVNFFSDSVEGLSLPFYPTLDIHARYVLRLMIQRPFYRLEIYTVGFRERRESSS